MNERTRTKGAASLLAVLGALLIASSIPALAQATVVEAGELETAGATRKYTLYRPVEPGQDPMPLVVVLHGKGGTGAGMAAITGFHETAAGVDALVAYPDGVENEWNYLSGLGGNDGVDDVAFLTDLVEAISERWSVDPERVFVAGFSNGGFMAQRLACEAESPFSAHASVAAAGFGGMPDLCAQPRPVSMLLIHGTADTVVPWDGQVTAIGGRELLLSASVPQTLGFWAAYAGCAGAGERESLPAGGRAPGTRVEVLSLDDCAGGHAVALYAIVNGGHNWPGREAGWPGAGPVNMDIDATEVIWEFFTAVPAPGVP